MRIANGIRVKVEYELSIDDEILESSEKTGPLEYIHGKGRMLPGLEKRLEGCEKGDEREGVIPPGEAYGNPEDLPTKALKRDEFPEGVAIEIGEKLEATSPEGAPVTFEITEIGEEIIVVRFTHPLAGKSIHFKVKVLDVTDTKPPPLPPA
ncbi:MAG: FKBP-type peptidyl-prolyl cis-trans isomerase [Deltaproteobacteria bacterium]|nr:FKBP-type peptidyl-prolyl cis-trans isomerase [Deltaproteobacteria bacterium]